MSATNIRLLKNRHYGGTIYVVGSGASLDFIDPFFFANPISVGVNDIWRQIRTTYVLMHHHEQAQAAIDAGVRLVTSDRDWGGPGWGNPVALTGEFYTYRTAENTRTGFPTIDVDALKADTTDSLVVSPCSTSEALQFAAHLGAATIICCGLDGAALDGRYCLSGYNGGASTNPQHLHLTQPIIAQTLAAIRVKGVRVYSLSPFVGAALEGHRWTFPPVLSGRDSLRAQQIVNWETPREVSA